MSSAEVDLYAHALRSAKIIKHWLQQCSLNHSSSPCDASVSTSFPKRLIYIDKEFNICRLIDTPNKAPEYVALSYCWGPSMGNFRTLKDTLPGLKEDGILSHELPPTLQHVIEVMKQLDRLYLWVDSLCIAQDDKEEWVAEAPKMGGVYSNAFLVISATGSENVHSGLFTRKCDHPLPERIAFHAIMKSCRTMPQRDWKGQIKMGFPLLCRGWGFQERLLARRIVHFTDFELVWECKEDRWCECGDFKQFAGPLKNANNMNRAFDLCCRVENQNKPEMIRPMWRECVKSYSRRDLTYNTDRLQAISGIAASLRPSSCATLYFAGLWRDFLPFDLLWWCDQTSQLNKQKIQKPCWSWSSVDCGVDWPITNNPEFEGLLGAISMQSYFEYDLEGVQVLHSQMDSNKNEILLFARMVPVYIRKFERPAVRRRAGETEWIVEGEDGRILPLYPDIQFSEEEVQRQSYEWISGCRGSDRVYQYLELVRSKHDALVWEAGILVRECPTDDNKFERFGMVGDISFQSKGTTWFEQVLRKEISLV